jgi:hypothetical protein
VPTADDEADWRSSLAKLAALEAHHEIALGPDDDYRSGAVGALGTALSRHLVGRGYSVAGVGLRRHEERLRALELELGAAFAGFPFEEDSTGGWDAALGFVARIDHQCTWASGLRIRRIQRSWRADADHRRPPDTALLGRVHGKIPSKSSAAPGEHMQESTRRFRKGFRGGDAALFATVIPVGDAAVAELRGLRADVRELIAIHTVDHQRDAIGTGRSSLELSSRIGCHWRSLERIDGPYSKGPPGSSP